MVLNYVFTSIFKLSTKLNFFPSRAVYCSLTGLYVQKKPLCKCLNYPLFFHTAVVGLFREGVKIALAL